MPTTVTKSIRASGGDYTTLEAFDVGEARDLVTADEVAKAEFYDDWPSGYGNGSESVDEAGWTVDSTRHILISVADGHRHDGTPQSGWFASDDSGGNADSVIEIGIQHTQLEWLDVENTRAGDLAAADAIVLSVNNTMAEKCFGKSAASRGFEGSGSGGSSGDWPKFINCIGYDCPNGEGIGASGARTRYQALNCGGFDSESGFVSGSTTQAIWKNCVAFGNTGDDFSGTFDADSDFLASEDTTASGATNNVTGVVSGDFTDEANDDWSLASGSALIDEGTDLSGEGFSDDMVGTARGATWDIGSFEFVAAGGGAAVLLGPIIQNYRNMGL